MVSGHCTTEHVQSSCLNKLLVQSFLIPVRFAGQDDKGDLYGGVLIQLKTYLSQAKDSKYPASAAYKLAPKFVFQHLPSTNIPAEQYIGLYVVIGGQGIITTDQQVVEWDPSRYKSYLDTKQQQSKKTPEGIESQSKKQKIAEKTNNPKIDETNCGTYWNLAIWQLNYCQIFDECLSTVLRELLMVSKDPTRTISDQQQQDRICKTLEFWIKPMTTV